jgi:hypothetical protein
MAKAQVNIESVDNFRQTVAQQRETIGEMNSNLISSASEMADKIAAELEKANQASSKCEQAKNTLSAKQEESNTQIEELYSQLASTPETITETSTDEDGNTTSEEVPNPEYAQLQGEIASVQARIDLLNGLQGRLDSLMNNLQIQKDLLSVSGSEVLEIIDTLSAQNTNFSNRSETAVEKLDKIRGALQDYLDTKIAPPGVSHGGYIKINTPMRYGQNGQLLEGTYHSEGNNYIPPLNQTEQVWHTDEYGLKVYDSPKETGLRLNYHQGRTKASGGEGVEGFQGTCGLVSVENVLRLAGRNITEADVVNYARTHTIGHGDSMRHLCTVDSESDSNGGTYAQDREALLRYYGVDSRIVHANVEQVAEYVAAGRGVIANVDANVLWYGCTMSTPAYHAITVTSVARDEFSNDVLGFYICDSGSRADDSSRFVPTEIFQVAMRPTNGQVNVTQIIR